MNSELNQLFNDLQSNYANKEKILSDSLRTEKRTKYLLYILLFCAIVPYWFVFPLEKIKAMMVVLDNNGIVTQVKPLDKALKDEKQENILMHSYLWDYVITRYSYTPNLDPQLLKKQINKIGYFSDNLVNKAYLTEISPYNPDSYYEVLGENFRLDIVIESLERISDRTVRIDFKTVKKSVRTGQVSEVKAFTATALYSWNNTKDLSTEGKYINPFGFKVIEWNINQRFSQN